MNKSSSKCHEEDGQLVAWDDVTGAMLDPRKAEMVYFKKMKVYEKVPKSQCYNETGKAPIGVRWVDVNKQDEKRSIVQIPIGRQGLQQLQGTGFVHSDAAFGISTSDCQFGCELPGQMWKAVENYGQRCQPCSLLRAKFEAHVRPDFCRRFRAGRRTPMWQAACINVWREASRRKLVEMLHRRSQGKRIHHISTFDVYLLSHHSNNYGIRAR